MLLKFMQVFMLVLLSKGMNSARNYEFSQSKCANRYEHRYELKQLAIGCKDTSKCTCEHLKSYNPLCGNNLTIAYGNFPPYVFFNHHKRKVEGILPSLINNALQTCCFGCTHVNYVGPSNHLDRFYRSGDVNISLPVFSTIKSSSHFGHDYIHMMESTTVTFLGLGPIETDAVKMGRGLLKSVFNIWPLFFTALIMATAAGITIWVLDNRANQSDFPAAFPRGPFEGFWWAFVSMTTVGYGDRYPRSTLARIFAVFWMLVGIMTFSMNTACLSSAIVTSVLAANEEILFQKNIAVLNTTSSIGQKAVLIKNSNAVGFETLDEITAAIKERRVDVPLGKFCRKVQLILSYDENHGACLDAFNCSQYSVVFYISFDCATNTAKQLTFRLLVTKAASNAMAVDENVAAYYAYKLKEMKIEDLTILGRQKVYDCSYGMVVYDTLIKDLFKTFFETNQDQLELMSRLAMFDITGTYYIKATDQTATANEIFSSSSKLFPITILTMIALGSCIIVVTLTVKKYYPKKLKSKDEKIMKHYDSRRHPGDNIKALQEKIKQVKACIIKVEKQNAPICRCQSNGKHNIITDINESTQDWYSNLI